MPVATEARQAITSRRSIYLGCVLLHFFLLISVSLRDMLWAVANDYTSLPRSFDSWANKAEDIAHTAVGEKLATSNLLRQITAAYLHGAGIDKGYGYFAPGVPNSYKLVFELHYADDRVEYELPSLSGKAAGVRMVTLLDHIGQMQYDPLREVILKMLAYSVWQEHPDAVTIRAVFGQIEEPTTAQAMQGQSESYQFLYAYDFSFAPQPASSAKP